MSSPQLRRADRAMSERQASAMLERGFSGRLATIGEDGYPYCIPLLYIWMDGELYVHTGSASGHLRANVEREPRICFEIDEPGQVFDYGRFECDSGLAYQSVIVFGKIRITEERAVKQRFCEALMAKYGKPETQRPKGFFPRIDVIHEFDGDDISETAIQRCIELSALKYCPVSAMLSAGATEIHHGYVIRSGGD